MRWATRLQQERLIYKEIIGIRDTVRIIPHLPPHIRFGSSGIRTQAVRLASAGLTPLTSQAKLACGATLDRDVLHLPPHSRFGSRRCPSPSATHSFGSSGIRTQPVHEKSPALAGLFPGADALRAILWRLALPPPNPAAR